MVKPSATTSNQGMPEHGGDDAFGWATEIRVACDAFFRRRGLNRYGGNKEVRPGMAGVVGFAAQQGVAKREKRAAKSAGRVDKRGAV